MQIRWEMAIAWVVKCTNVASFASLNILYGKRGEKLLFFSISPLQRVFAQFLGWAQFRLTTGVVNLFVVVVFSLANTFNISIRQQQQRSTVQVYKSELVFAYRLTTTKWSFWKSCSRWHKKRSRKQQKKGIVVKAVGKSTQRIMPNACISMFIYMFGFFSGYGGCSGYCCLNCSKCEHTKCLDQCSGAQYEQSYSTLKMTLTLWHQIAYKCNTHTKWALKTRDTHTPNKFIWSNCLNAGKAPLLFVVIIITVGVACHLSILIEFENTRADHFKVMWN